jgi:hypothetical protein
MAHKIRVVPLKKSAVGIKHPIDGALKPAIASGDGAPGGSEWTYDAFTCALLREKAIEEAPAELPAKAAAPASVPARAVAEAPEKNGGSAA